MRYSIFLITSLCYCLQANAQISGSLYKALPDTLRPKYKSAITDQEGIRIILNASRPLVEQYTADFRVIDQQLEKNILSQRDTANKTPYADAIAGFYMLTGNDAGTLIWNKNVILFGQASKTHSSIVSNAYNNLALYYSTYNRQDSAINMLHLAKDVALAAHDSEALRRIYLAYSNIYGQLTLFRQALVYINKYLAESPIRNQWDDDYTNQYLIKARIYSILFRDEGKRMYADSARRLLQKIMDVKKNQSATWYPYCYDALGLLAYYNKNYKETIRYFDLLLLDKKYVAVSTRAYRPILYKNASLLMMGRSEAINPLLAINIRPNDYYSHKALHDAFYQYYKKQGDYQKALSHYTQYRAWADSIDVAGQRGKVFEAEQKYSVAQKEAAIAELKTESLEAQASRTKLVVGAIISVLILAILALLLYVRNKRQQAQRLAERQKLTDDLQTLEQEMELNRLRQQAESEAAMIGQRKAISKNMHDEVSSDLAAVRYFITDLKGRVKTSEARQVLADVEDEVQTVYQQSRDFMHRLNETNIPETYNVLNLLENLSLRFNKESKLYIHTQMDARLDRKLTSRQHSELYKLIKEAVANCLKHSGANRMDIILGEQDGQITLYISDNGHGIKAESGKGLGLATMQERIEGLGGHIVINPSEQGLQIQADFPK